MADSIEFYGKALRAMLGLTITRTVQQIQAASHRWTYRETPNPKNIVILGGSYAGTWLARRLGETLPTGYRAVLIERNSHFNHLFVLPRYSVVPGREQQAFIPYDGLAASVGPPGIFQHVRAHAVGITPTQVQLGSGETVDYDYLAIATGSWQPPPSKPSSPDKAQACAELQASQQRIHDADRIAVLGGGPVGIQTATDIAAYFPDKKVTLVHSRPQLLSHFGPKLHENVTDALKRLHVNVVLGERPQIDGQSRLSYTDGRTSRFDLVIPCTGQRPNSAILETLAPSAICPTTKQILVRPTMQIQDGHPDTRVFSIGDVAQTGGPRMARAARAQADVATLNILAMINGESPSTQYIPQVYESVIKLTLGKNHYIYYGQDENGKEVFINGTAKSDDLDIGHAWENLGAHLPEGQRAQSFPPTPALTPKSSGSA